MIAREVFQRVAGMANIEIHSISTHMPVSNEDAEYTRDQLVRFQKIVDQIRAEVPGSYKAHVLQSAGTLAFNQPTHDIVRAGIMLYGISPLPEFRRLAQTGDDVENTNLSCARRAEGQLNQLWPHVYRAAKYARCNVVSRLCRRLPVASVQPWRRLFGARKALPSSRPGDDGLDGDRCERAR